MTEKKLYAAAPREFRFVRHIWQREDGFYGCVFTGMLTLTPQDEERAVFSRDFKTAERYALEAVAQNWDSNRQCRTIWRSGVLDRSIPDGARCLLPPHDESVPHKFLPGGSR